MIKKLIGQFKSYLMIYAAIAVVGLIASAYVKGRVDGVNACERVSDKATHKETGRQRKAADDLSFAERKNEEKIKERIVYIKQKIKPGSCLAVDLPDDIINELGGLRRPSSSRRQRSEAG
ncbi:MAG: hypothetical protein BMS9Abin02_1987 [Anaerolineae bacterium]|nr:MAG: hypothetical protein BMS9Abin02_1987 [Anaerolineae bacterium]